VEQGAGTGRLAHDLLRWASKREPAFYAATTYRMVEISASLQARQRQTLGGLANVEWLEALPDAIDGVVLTNELLDSFPVQRVRYDADLREVCVALAGQRFIEELRPPSTPRIVEYFEALGIQPAPGCTVEVNLHALDWMAEVGSKLQRGFVLTLDYGYEAPELYAPWRTDGTLMCFYQHNPSHDPYARIGKQDMTTHIDFTSIERAGTEHGLDVAGFTTQARFLANMGIGGALEEVAREEPGALEEYYARRRAVTDLIDPAGLGRIRVLAQRKGVDATALAGFKDSDG
jgi:SAM-dependent MidA family methyltransferase